MSEVKVLTIDGPSGAGKGTVSRAIAKRLGWHFLDSGAIYRALALTVLEQKIPLTAEDEIALVAEKMKVEFKEDDNLKVFVDGREVTEQLASEECGRAASQIAALAKVRKALLAKQRAFRKPPGVVADGRDMGTVVFPDAPYKVFLTASLEERARRRFLQLKAQGINVTLDQIIKDLEERDRRDRERKEAPLRPAQEAVIIDSSNLSVEEVIAKILALLPPELARGAV